MKIDPEKYDLRELRRIADERREDRRGRTSESSEASGEDADERSSSAYQTKSGDVAERTSASSRTESDDVAEQSSAGRQTKSGDVDETRSVSSANQNAKRSGDESDGRRPRRKSPPNRSGRNGTRRSRNGRDAPRRSRNDSRRGRNEDRRRRDGRSERLSRPREGHSDHGDAQDEVVRADRLASRLGLDHLFGDSARGDEGRGGQRYDGREHDDYDYDGYDELGYSAFDESRSADGSFGHDAGYDRRSDDYSEDVGRFRFDNEVHERSRERAGDALRQNQLEQLLIHETAAADDSLEKPYLRTLPDEYAAERVVFDWLEFLVLKGGFKRTVNALRYYLTVDWITEEVETELHDYLVGFSGNVADTTEFDADDHHLSLLYVARLASMA